MTVTYSQNCSKTGLGTFFRLLLRWKGSIYKLMYKEMIIYILIYFALSLSYRFAMNESQQKIFERICLTCDNFTSFIPLTFVLSFYVETIVERWWKVFEAFAWVDRTALHVSCFLHGRDEESRIIRRTIMRYLNLAHVFVLRDISSAVKKRFPSYEHVINAGLITEDELRSYMDPECAHHRHWFPIQWCFDLLAKAREDERITSDYLLHKITNEVLAYRDNLQELLNYDWISIPLIYTQVATLAVYTFFLFCLLGRQYLDPSKGYEGHELDLYVPFFTFLQFVFYVGWLKVAETLINPLGEDDDDFEVNYILDRNLQVGFVMVDEAYNKLPPLERDIHWNEILPEIPYTEASYGLRDSPDIGSADAVHMKEEDFQIASENEIRRRRSRGSKLLRRFSRQPNLAESRLSSANEDSFRKRKSSKNELATEESVLKIVDSGTLEELPEIVVTPEDSSRKSFQNGSAIKHLDLDLDKLKESEFSIPNIVVTNADESRKNSFNEFANKQPSLDLEGVKSGIIPAIFVTPASRKSSLNEFARRLSSDLEIENMKNGAHPDVPEIIITPASRKSSQNEFARKTSLTDSTDEIYVI